MEKEGWKAELDSFPVVIYRQVQWGEMDPANHVNNVVYLRWSETARLEYFVRMGLAHSFRDKGPILAFQDCKYIYPVTYPDKVFIGVRINEILSDRFNIQCKMYSEKHKRIVAISNHITMAYDYDKLKKISIPDEWIEAINQIEASIGQ